MSRAYTDRYFASRDRKKNRRGLIAKANVLWKDLRPDLRHSSSELREARLEFARVELKLASLGSFNELSDYQLERLVRVLQREHSNRVLPGYEKHHLTPASGQGAEVYHLASKELVWAIEQVFNYLGWSAEYREKVIFDRFNRKSPRMLSPKSARSLLRILFTFAAHRDLKLKHGKETAITKAMMAIEIPVIKQRLGIDQKK